MSVRKRTWKTAKGEERTAWIVDYVDQGGQRHIESFSRKKDADERESEVRINVKAGTHVAPSKSITVAEAAAKWLESAEVELERATVDQYRQHVKYHIAPFIGMVRLTDLTSAAVLNFEARLRSEHRSKAMIKRVLVSLGSILADAQMRNQVGRNTVREIHRSRRGSRQRSAKREQVKLKVGEQIPSPPEVSAIIAHAKPRWRPLLLIAAFTGLRASELRGLRWSDVDFKTNELHVRQRADRYNAIGSPKTASSRRTVPFGSYVAAALKDWRARGPKGELVFPNGKGGIEYHTHIVNRGLIPAVVAAGVVTRDGKAKYTGLHALRHFYASLCINRREDGGFGLLPKNVQERMGHSTITVTLDTYGHLFPRSDDSEAMDAVEGALLSVVA